MNAEKTGELIRSIRKEKNITQQQLAEMIHVSDKAVSRWETGRGFPDIGNLEDISESLEVSVAELLRGERFEAQVTKEDVSEASAAGLEMARIVISRKKWINIALGFLCGAIVILLLFVRLLSPIPIEDAENALSVETLSGNELVAVFKNNVAGYELQRDIFPDEDGIYVSLSCYETLWNRLFGEKSRMIVSLGKIDETDYVYYYPSRDSDQLIWKAETAASPSGGTVTLPRRIYVGWMFIGVLMIAIGVICCIIFRKKAFFEIVLKITMLPAAAVLSIIAILAGGFDTVYNAMYYFVGIVLLTALIYILFLFLYGVYKARKVRH